MPPLSDPQERRCLYGHINLIQEHQLWSGCFLNIEIVLQIVCVFKYFLQFTVFCNKNNNYERYLFKETLTDFNTSNKILISRGEQVMRRSAVPASAHVYFVQGVHITIHRSGQTASTLYLQGPAERAWYFLFQYDSYVWSKFLLFQQVPPVTDHMPFEISECVVQLRNNP